MKPLQCLSSREVVRQAENMRLDSQEVKRKNGL
jgi:hypothetical protein